LSACRHYNAADTQREEVRVAVLRWLKTLGCLAALVVAVSSCTPASAGYVRIGELAREFGLEVERDPLVGRAVLRGERSGGLAEVVVSPGLAAALVNGELRRLPHPSRYRGTEVLVAEELREAVRRALLLTPLPRPGGVVRKVLLDPGHGGKDPGAIGPTGLREKDVNLDVARRLARLLRRRGMEVVLTRTADVFVPLAERSRIANREQPDLFISIHADAAPRASAAGATSYVVQEVFRHSGMGTVTMADRAALAQRDAPLNPTHVGPEPPAGASQLALWQVMLAEYRRESRLFAETVQRRLPQQTGQPDRGVREAAYAVLKWTYAPAVLIEVGFLSHRTWEARLADPAYREQTAQAIAEAVFEFDRKLALAEAGR